MPKIVPFRAYLYNQERVPLQDVVAPPYDVISPEQQAKLYEKSPYNVVRLILGREENRYEAAAAAFSEWQKKSVLVRDAKPAMYVLHQMFDDDQGRLVTRKGFIALCRLVEFKEGVVLPHEKTLAKPREDRLKLMKATNANLSQIFSLYSDPEKQVDRELNGFAREKPVVDAAYEDVQNKLWRLTDPASIQRVQEVISDKQVLIADGHHRYETALAYRTFLRSQRKNPGKDELYDYVMMFFTNVDDEGLVIYPTQRVVHSLSQFDPADFFRKVEVHFIVREFKERGAALAALGSSSVSSFAVAVKGMPGHFLLSVKPTSTPAELIHDDLPPVVKELDVTVLHSGILKDILGISPEAQEQKRNLEYVRGAKEALEQVEKGTAQLAFVMNATKIQQVRAVAKAGYTMPQKSTYFYPKLLSGLVINKLSD